MITVKDFSLQLNSQKILANINCEFSEGVTAIVGPSGVGKTTFLLCLNRLIELKGEIKTSGEINFKNKNIFDKDQDLLMLRKKIGMVFQRPTPFPISLYDNLRIVLLENAPTEKKNFPYMIESVLRKVNLWDEVSDKLSMSALHLSGGQQQKLCLARVLLMRPEMILLDEPCSSLDPISTEQIESLLKELSFEVPIVIVTHNLKQAKRIANNLIVFGQNEKIGRIVETGKVLDIFQNPKDHFTRLYLEYDTL